jgi:hypothetical protein
MDTILPGETNTARHDDFLPITILCQRGSKPYGKLFTIVLNHIRQQQFRPTLPAAFKS